VVHPVPTPAETPGPALRAALPATPRESTLGLLVILSGIALAAFAVRTAAMAQAMASTGAPMPWRLVLATETANWIGWTLWAILLVPVVRRVVDRSVARTSGIGVLVAMAILPVVAIPVVASPVHRLGFGQGGSLFEAFRHMVTHNAPTSLLLGVTMVGVANGYLGLQRARRLEVTAARLHAQLADAQLETLRSQLNPHFLFNALNSIAVLARRGQVVPVEQMVTRLASLLRHSLDSARSQHVALRVELEALRHYLDIEQVRFENRLVVSVKVPELLHDRVVPSFLLQPLVENAIRHGLTDPRQPLRVGVSARTEGPDLVLEITDDGAGLADREPPADGMGLGLTRARLAGLYGARASLTLAPGEGGRGTRVLVTLPVNVAPDTTA
jgi:two-component system LytT family sensor kinase